ncbi:MAG: hypothetical protein WCO53_06905 [Deltaproteobacteria bacterium]
MKRLAAVVFLMMFFILTGEIQVTYAAEPLSFQMPENKAILVSGVFGIVTPSKLGSKYYLVAKGGTPPYALSVAGDAVSVAPRKKTSYGLQAASPQLIDTFDITPLRAGTATLILRDSTGAASTAQFVVTVLTPLTATMSRRNLQKDEADILGVAGGTKPYTVVTNNTTVSLTPSIENRWRVTALSPGEFILTVRDAGNNTFSYVGAVVAPLIGRVLPQPYDTYDRLPAGIEVTLTISGGIKPYSAKANNSNVSLTKSGDNIWRIKTLTPGEFIITVEDASQRGLSYVYRGTVKKLEEITLKLTASTIHVSDFVLNPKEAVLNISGGKPPYTVTQIPERRLTITKISESSYRITGSSPGGEVHWIHVKDAVGKTTSTQISITRPLVVKCPTREVVIPENSPGCSVSFVPIYIDIMNGSGPFTVQNINTDLIDVSPPAYGTRPTYERPQERAASSFIRGKSPGNAKIKISDSSTSVECAVKVIRYPFPAK